MYDLMKKSGVILLLIILLFFEITPPILANDYFDNIITVNPAPGFNYNLKRIKEKAFLFILTPFPQYKAYYYEELLNTRLSEFKYVVVNKDLYDLQGINERYFTTAGELTELILDKKSLDDQKDNTKKLLSKHLTVVDKFKEYFNDTTAEWRFIKQTSDYLQIYISQLSN